MRLRDAALGLHIAATIPYVWLRTRLLPLPRALAGLTPGDAPDRLSAQSKEEATTDERRWTQMGESHSLIRVHLRSSVVHSLSRFRSFAFPRSQSNPPTSEQAERIIRLTDLLLDRRVALLRPSCMLRSLVLYRFLREAGVPVQVNFGVARDGEALKGHSWLTLHGVPYAEPIDPTPRFHVVYRYPEGSSQ
jgi:hypothetical protein